MYSPPVAPPRLPRGVTLNRYLLIVGLIGLTLLWLIARHGGWWLGEMDTTRWVLVCFLVLGELMPIRLAGHDDEVTTSTAFSFALLLTVGLAPAAITQALASVLADLRLRKSLRSTIFNAGQYTISLTAAGLVLFVLTGLPRDLSAAPLRAQELAALAASGLVFFGLNNVLAGAAYALADRSPILEHLRQDLGFQAWTAALVLGFSPLVIAVGAYDQLLLPFLLLPLLAIYRAGRDARQSEHNALHDRLTELPNRALFRRRAIAATREAAAEGHHTGVLMLDLDRFKEINDTLGHAHGDLLLQALAGRLKGSLREVDTVARIGGDEFAVLLPIIDDRDEVEGLARRLLDALHEPFVVRGVTLTVTASIGIACFPDHGEDVDLLLQRADVAMYVAKGRFGGIESYDEADDQNSVERLSLAVQVRDAAARDELVLHFQPQVDLVTGSLVAAEALMRWQHPQRGLIPPDTFIPIAENTGAIRDLTTFALEAALTACRRWLGSGIDAGVSVNVTAQDVLDQGLPEAIARMLADTGVAASRLELELTETMLMADPERAAGILRALSAMGVGVAIDDFGTGYSSLGYLKRLPVDKIKIDRTFVSNMQHDAKDAAIVASTIDLARNLKLLAVAEGIEDTEAVSELLRMGCTLGQGYAFAKPLPLDELIAWATTERERARPDRPPGAARALRAPTPAL
jgi:diguanylate cyclase (GGDEF)-like protein